MSAADTASSLETQETINALMLEFRQLIIGLQEEQDDLKEKLRQQAIAAKALKRHTISTSRGNSSNNDNNNNPHQHHHHSDTYHRDHNHHNYFDRHRQPQADQQKQLVHQRHLHSSSHHQNNHNKTNNHHHYHNYQQQSKLLIDQIPLPPLRTKRKQQTSSRMTSSVVSRGALIVLEGLDRVGKSTLATKLVDHLQKTQRPVSHCRFPDRSTPVGKLIDEFLRSSSRRVDDHVMHLLFSANRWELSQKIRNTLKQGTSVIVDRYSYSGIAYSSSQPDLKLDWCRCTEEGLPKPDLVIYLELPREAQYKRAGFGDERFETREMQEMVRLQYEKVMEITKEKWLRVDVENKSPDQVLGEVIIPVKRCLEESANKDLDDLDFFKV